MHVACRSSVADLVNSSFRAGLHGPRVSVCVCVWVCVCVCVREWDRRADCSAKRSSTAVRLFVWILLSWSCGWHPLSGAKYFCVPPPIFDDLCEAALRVSFLCTLSVTVCACMWLRGLRIQKFVFAAADVLLCLRRVCVWCVVYFVCVSVCMYVRSKRSKPHSYLQTAVDVHTERLIHSCLEVFARLSFLQLFLRRCQFASV